MDIKAHQTWVTNLDYETTNNVIEIFNKIFVETGKVVRRESKLITPTVWKVVLKNRAREFVQFKIYINTPTNYTLKIKVSLPSVLSERTKQKLEKSVNAVLNNEAVQK
jgi:hypothetical protein